jgi:serine/threonine-protein kinase
MEFCGGSTLRQVLSSRGALDERIVRKILGQLAAALKYIHELGLIHRDLKPSNIMMSASGTLKLLDFGLVKFDGWRVSDTDQTTQAAALVGTPRYMAPELFAGLPRSPNGLLWLGVRRLRGALRSAGFRSVRYF